jgi:SSS family solute:Na+ symporter
MLTGFVTSAFWSICINAKTATGLGICQSLVGKPTLQAGSATFSATWGVVDPILVALPLAALVAVLVTFITKPLPAAHVAYVFGGPKPTE